jgi:uncharacterized membrane protein
MSADGSVVAGRFYDTPSFQGAMRWTAATGMQPLELLPGADDGAAVAVSADGSTIVGWVQDVTSGNLKAVRWTGSGIQDLGKLPGTQHAEAIDVSGDGSVVIGECAVGTPEEGYAYYPFVWTEANGMLSLEGYLALYGVAPLGFSNPRFKGMSDDALVIVGLNDGPDHFDGFVIELDGAMPVPVLSQTATVLLGLLLLGAARWGR